MTNLIIRSVLVNGSSRGIGLELVKSFLTKQSPPVHIFAACRNPDSVQELKSLSSKHSNLSTVRLDVTNPTSIESACRDITERLNGQGLNLLINNAGIAVFHSLHEATAEDMLEMYKTNAIGPMLVTKALFPLLKKAAQESPNEVKSCSRAAVINISSGAASIERIPLEFSIQPLFEYRCSKVALNMLTRCQAEVYKKDGIIAVAVAPGWVQTDMGGPKATLKLHESVGGMMNMFDTLTEKHNGVFLNWRGQPLPW